MLDTNKDSLKLEAMKRIVAVRGEAEVGGAYLGGGVWESKSSSPWLLVDLPVLSAGLPPSSSPLALTHHPDDCPGKECLRPVSCCGEERGL